MGMFDSIMIDIDCPKCGQKHEVECQTKKLSCLLNVYKVGDVIFENVNELECITDCLNISGERSIFYITIYLKRGRISGDYRIVNH